MNNGGSTNDRRPRGCITELSGIALRTQSGLNSSDMPIAAVRPTIQVGHGQLLQQQWAKSGVVNF